ncbi:hypothetical protein AB6802_04620 [Mesorhizobium sp. RCC_202]|uniref:hypothetical protein n=1 Tax=Mesorhizobium sp. RCC_202 TaxID=3239222 RepID=UPI0035254CEA
MKLSVPDNAFDAWRLAILVDDDCFVFKINGAVSGSADAKTVAQQFRGCDGQIGRISNLANPAAHRRQKLEVLQFRSLRDRPVSAVQIGSCVAEPLFRYIIV